MSQPDIQYFGSSGQWVKPAGAVRVDVLLQGAGGGAGITIAGMGTDGTDGELSSHSFAADMMPEVVEVEVGKGGRPGGRDGYVLVVTHLEGGQ